MDLNELLARTGNAPVLVKTFEPNNPFRRHVVPSRAPLISIIIPAHNEEAYLEQTLAALNAQRYPNFEIIVVANGCTDGTAEVARGKCHRLVVLSQKSLGVARNLGARMAKGDLLVFLDADTILESRALRVIARQFTEQCAAGTVKGCPDSDRLPYRLIYFMKNFTHKMRLHSGSSGVILCWKKHFMQLGGFDEAMEVRENSHLIQRLKVFGRYKYISRTVAVTSMRRYERRGVGRMVWLWLKLWCESFFTDLRNRKYEIVR